MIARMTLALACATAVTGCERPGRTAPPKEDMSTPQLTIDVTIDGDGTAALAVRCTVTNAGAQPVQLFDSKRMPYLLDEGGTLVVLHGVHPPPDDRDYNIIEIPTTRPLGAGESLTFDVALVPLRLHGHFEDQPATTRHGPTPLVCRVGHGATAITEADRPRTTIDKLLSWQQLVSSAPVSVTFP